MVDGLFKRFLNFILDKKADSKDQEVQKTVDHDKEIDSQDLENLKGSWWKIDHIEPDSDEVKEGDNVAEQTAIPEKEIKKQEVEYFSRELYIGFDLGTSCSKVIVRDNIDQRVIPVSFNKYGYESNTFLLPTKLYFRQDKLSMEKLLANDIEITDIKTNFINNTKSDNGLPSAEIVLISYLTIAFRQIREFVIQKRSIYQKSELNWHVNIGIPCLDVINNALVEKYEKAILDAWNISLYDKFFPYDGSIVIELVNEFIKTTKSDTSDESNKMKEYICVFPELFASIKSQIDQHRLDLNRMYYMVDIGAGTVDMATFNLFRDDEDDLNYAIFVPTIKQIGSYRFSMDLINNLEIDDEQINQINDILLSLAEGNKEYDLYDLFDSRVVLNDIYDQYLHEYRTQIGTTIITTKDKYYPNAHEWTEGVPTFIVGGGKSFKINNNRFYVLSLNNEFIEMSNRGFLEPNIIKTFPPEYFESEESLKNNHHRFLVADGLADDKMNLGKVLTKVKMIDNQECPVVDIEDKYISKDVV